jgi:ketosteroid isomerase-like protein
LPSYLPPGRQVLCSPRRRVSREDFKVAKSDHFDDVFERYHSAAAEFINGNPEPYKALFSQGEDVTVGNPFGPFARGWQDVATTMERASALYRDGEVTGFENLAKCTTSDLAYIVEVERFSTKVAGSHEAAPVALRTTSIFRREDGAWKIVHRHADPITAARPPDSVVQK